MKINISVNPYLIIKMLVLSYMDGAKKDVQIDKNFEKVNAVQPRCEHEKIEVQSKK